LINNTGCVLRAVIVYVLNFYLLQKLCCFKALAATIKTQSRLFVHVMLVDYGIE